MREYKITHREELVGWFYVEAENEEDAIDVFYKKIMSGEIDVNDLSIVNSSDTAEPEEVPK